MSYHTEAFSVKMNLKWMRVLVDNQCRRCRPNTGELWSNYLVVLISYSIYKESVQDKIRITIHQFANLTNIPYEKGRCNNTEVPHDQTLWEYDTENHTEVQPHWKISETALKIFTKDNHTEFCSLITLKFVCYRYPRMLIPFNPTENFQRYSYPLFSQYPALLWFSVWFSESYSGTEIS